MPTGAQEFDVYVDIESPSLGLYVLKGAGLPDLTHASRWQFVGHIWRNELPPDVVRRLDANGHAFQDLGN